MSGLRAWIHWRRDLRRLRRAAHEAYDCWMRAQYAYSDVAAIFGGEPRAWSSVDPIGKAQDELTDRTNEYLALAEKVRRMEEVGPAWTTCRQ